MGTTNRQRRADKARRMKAKRRQQEAKRNQASRRQDPHRRDQQRESTNSNERQAPPPWPFSGASTGPRDSDCQETSTDRRRELISQALDQTLTIGPPVRVAMLSALRSDIPTLVADEIEARLLAHVGRLWSWGWLPSELVRQTRREAGARASEIMASAIAADHAARPPSSLHHRWVSNLESLDLPEGTGSRGWLLDLASNELPDWSDTLLAALEALMSMLIMAPMAKIIPPPGASSDSAEAGKEQPSIIDLSSQANGGKDSTILERVRALLAQAESTTFEAEAETFTAKAQELMARHAIDVAMVWGRSSRTEEPIMIRIAIDEPYANAKSLLLHHVATNSRCRVIQHSAYAICSVVGFQNDLTATELLFTSLLVQAHQALQQVSEAAPPGSRSRSRGFRSSFLTAYATRIGQRLARVNADVEAEHCDRGTSDHLPVLADRSSLIDKVVEEEFPTLTSRRSRATHDPLGWGAGHDAANRAQLDFNEVRSHRPEL